MRAPYPLVFSAVFLLPSCAESETAPLSDTSVADTGSEAEPEPDTAPEDTATDARVADTSPGDTRVDSTVADTSTPDTLVADTSMPDTFVADTSVTDTAPADTGFKSTDHVHIYISNTCKVTVSPTSFTVPAGETLKLSYHNHSVDYRADVWMMYGGGYLGLDRGATWNETYTHCFGPSASTGYADINIEGGPTSGCPGVRLYIYCK